MIKFCLVVPTLNPGNYWPKWVEALQTQCMQPSRVVVIDSNSTDGFFDSSIRSGLELKRIARHEFNHGATRQLGVETVRNDCEIVLFLTQDAIIANPHALKSLIQAFDDPKVGAAYGRQLPHADASALAAHARLFNYPDASRVVSLADQNRLGLKTCFMSNSFAAYRVSDLLEVGGFPSNVILGEDMAVAARLLLAGKRVAYQAGACAFHSHNYTPLEDFRRYFDTGVFHAREQWLLDSFGGANGEGLRFVKSELLYLLKNAPWLIPSALLRTVLKLVGYRLGRAEARISLQIKRRLSMFNGFWV